MEYGVTELVVNASPIMARAGTERQWHPLIHMGGKSSAGVEVHERSAVGYPPLWRAINLISSSVAGLPFDVFRRQRNGGKKVDLKHPAQILLRRRANAWTSAYSFKKAMTAIAILHGNSYAYIDRTEGRPTGLVMWSATQTLVRLYEGDLWYVTYIDGQPVRIRGQDMLHIRGLGGDGICGWPVLEIMKDALGVGMAAQQFGGRFFGQGSNMSGLLMIPGHFNEEKIRNTMNAWNEMSTGLSQAHKVALLQDGVKFQQLSISNDNAQFLETRDYEVRATVANITGVPPHMLGDSTRTSHNSLESEAQSYLDYTLQPWLKCWEDETEDKLLTDRQKENDSHVIEFNREALVQMSFADKINGIAKQLETSILSRNEARALMNWPSLGPDGDVYYQPANWLEVGADPMEQPGQQPPEPPDQSRRENAALRELITSTVTKDLQIERDRVIQRAGMRASTFIDAVEEFYETWTASTAAGLTASSARAAVIRHAEESKRQLLDVAGVSTTESLKANVSNVVATWQTRADNLIENLLKAVQK